MEILGPAEGGNFGAAECGKFSNFSLKFRAFFENFEKEQKKTDVFNLVGPLKVENFKIFFEI